MRIISKIINSVKAIEKKDGGALDKVLQLKEKTGLSSVTPTYMITEIIKTVFGFLAVLFVILIIVSGYQWMTAGGNSETITKARQRMINATIGLVIVLAAFAITEFILDRVIMAVD